MGRFQKILMMLFLVVMSFGLVGCSGSGSDDAFNGGDGGGPGDGGDGGDGGGAGDGGDGGGTGDGSGNGGGTGVPGSGAQLGTVTNIAISYPNTNAIENIGSGIYRRTGSAFVTDIDGNTVPDGTEILFKIIDSIKATGTINVGNGDSISGTVLTDNGVTLSDGVPTNFDAAYVIRNDTFEFISSQDQLFLTSLSGGGQPVGFKADMARSVASGTGATVTVTNSYANNYPNITYPTDGTSYVLGGSHIGVEVAGADENGVLTTGIGSTIDGIVNFRITYPANSNTLAVGCVENDPRYLPIGSADIYLMASNSSGTIATIDEPCLSRIADGTLTSIPTASSGSAIFTLRYLDGGDDIPVPYSRITPTAVVTGAVTVTFNGTVGGNYITDVGGQIFADVTITGGASGDTAVITFTVDSEPTATVNVTVTLP